MHKWSENIVLVELPPEPKKGKELKSIAETIRDKNSCNVVLDFSNVDIVTSSSPTKLLKLHKFLTDSKCQLIFCSVAPATRGIFTMTGLNGVFQIIGDKSAALASLQMVS